MMPAITGYGLSRNENLIVFFLADVPFRNRGKRRSWDNVVSIACVSKAREHNSRDWLRPRVECDRSPCP